MKLSLGEWSVRSYEERDVAALVHYADNRKIWKNLMDFFPHPYTEQDARTWIQQARTQNPETNFAIATEDELIGAIGLELQKDIHRKSAALGYWLGEPFWGRGIVTNAVQEMTDYAFRHYDLVRIYAGVFESNLSSARVLEKAGYLYEARLRKHVYKDEKIQDLLIYAILRNEWTMQIHES